MPDEIKHYIKDIQKILGLNYKDLVESIKVLEPTWEPKGGPNASINDTRFRQVCAKHNVQIKQSTDTEVTGTIHKSTNPGTITIAPDDPIINRYVSDYDNIALAEYNTLNAEDLCPLKVKARIAQIDQSEASAIHKLAKVKKVYRTILKHNEIHDAVYLQGLFQPYQFLMVPSNISRRQRQKLGLEGFFLHVYVTERFNNKLIAFNKDEALYAFIINV